MDVLLDTHVWVWSWDDNPKLTQKARAAIAGAEAVRVSPISLYEIGQKARIGKWPEIEPYLDDLPERLTGQGGLTATFSNEVALLSATLDWPHRDPFDRILAATAILSGAALISADTMFDTLGDARLQRIW